MRCFICNIAGNVNGFTRIDRDDNIIKREIAVRRRIALGRDDIQVTDRTRLCFGCNRSIIEEMEMQDNPHAMTLNVIFPFHTR